MSGVIETIAPDDAMFSGDARKDLAIGASALHCIDVARRAAQAGPPRRILDLPCGHGRVLRHLHAAFPDAELVACDIDREGIAFCAEAFGAIPVASGADLAAVPLPGAFDLVWCGSLFTHLDQPDCLALFDLLERHLAPGGLLVFTTHGRRAAEILRSTEMYSLPGADRDALLTTLERTGFGFVPYPDQERYGVSMTSLEWLVRGIGQRQRLSIVNVTEFGWDHHQDVIACRAE